MSILCAILTPLRKIVMTKFKVLIADGLAEEGIALLQRVADVTSKPKITTEELIAELPQYQALGFVQK